jgi:hypothetical protein
MSDPVWYYGEGERQKGPVTADELKRLVELGRVKPTDLVWQPGMDDWVPAKSIRGLVPESVDLSEPADAPLIDGGFEDEVLTRRRRRRSGLVWGKLDWSRWTGRGSRGLALGGLLLIVAARGCDELGAKYARRQQVLVDLSKSDADAAYRKRRGEVQAKLDQASRGTLGASEQALANYREQLNRIDSEYVSQQAELSRTTWMDLEINSRAANARHAAWQPWFAAIGLAGSLALVYGLFQIAFDGQAIERWGAWIAIAILLLRLLGWSAPL